MVKQLAQLLKYSSPASIICTYIRFIYILHLITLYFLDFTVIYNGAAGRLVQAAQAGLFRISCGYLCLCDFYNEAKMFLIDV